MVDLGFANNIEIGLRAWKSGRRYRFRGEEGSSCQSSVTSKTCLRTGCEHGKVLGGV